MRPPLPPPDTRAKRSVGFVAPRPRWRDLSRNAAHDATELVRKDPPGAIALGLVALAYAVLHHAEHAK